MCRMSFVCARDPGSVKGTSTEIPKQKLMMGATRAERNDLLMFVYAPTLRALYGITHLIHASTQVRSTRFVRRDILYAIALRVAKPQH